MRTKWIIVLWFCLTTSLRAAAADEWSQFRGPNGSGVATASSVPTEWSTDKNVQWKTKIPGVAWSSPIVWGDKVFVTTAITENQRKPQAGGGFGGGGFGGGGPGGGGQARGGAGGFGTPPPPGQILPQFLQERLSLSDKQKKQLEDLQKDVDAKVEKNLTDEQKKQLKDLRGGSGGGRPGGFGGGGGRVGFGGFSQPGQILSASIQEQLKLSEKQKQQYADLQKEVDGQLAKLLTDDQNKQFKEMREAFGRGGPGGGRPGGFGGGGAGPGGGGGRGGFGGGGSPPNVVYRWEVICLDRATGSVLWRELALEGKPRIPTQPSNTYASETPVTDGERVYAYFGMHGLFCYTTDGKLVWKKDLGAFPMQMGWGSSSSPVLDSERLYLQIDNEEKSFLVALDKKTGDEVWRVAREEKTNWGSPIVWKNKVRTELVTPGSQKIRSYDPATGKLLWELGSSGQSNSTPVGDADLLYVGCESRGGGFGGGEPGGPGGGGGGRGGFGGGASGGSLFAVRAGAAGDVTLKDGETSNAGVAWSVPRSGPEKSSPLVYQGYVYILRQNGGIVTCYAAKTGKQVYRERIPNAGAFWASPWASDGKVFCLDGDGTTHVLKSGADFKVLGKNTLEEMTWATPAIAGGALLVRGVDHLYSIR